MFEDIKRGDIAVFSDGSAHRVKSWFWYNNERIRIIFKDKVVGFIDRERRESFVYDNKGIFVRACEAVKANDIVKVIHDA